MRKSWRRVHAHRSPSDSHWQVTRRPIHQGAHTVNMVCVITFRNEMGTETHVVACRCPPCKEVCIVQPSFAPCGSLGCVLDLCVAYTASRLWRAGVVFNLLTWASAF